MSPSATILVVEDKDSEREALARLLRLEDYEVVSVASAEEANQHLDDKIDMVISDLRMGRASGVDLLRFWKERRRHVPFVMITAHGEVDSAVRAMKLGAEDYLSKPVNPDELLMLVKKCLESARKDETIQLLQHRLDQRLGFENIIGQSRTMINVFENARRAAMVNSTVVITGESGSGKELIAEAIHQNSPRKKGPFVTVNMAAVPEQLVESELFGHTKGAFTGATESREGRFEAADKGTIFIDEIGDFAIESQAKLLRVLENHRVTPVGSNRDREVDVRVVAATSRNLEKMVEDETFRKDLYYRLHVVTLHLPPLRERREDIPLLINHFMREHSKTMDVEPLQISPDLREYLEAHDWPGNVRQLRNCLESMIVLSRGNVLTLDDLPAMVEHGPSTSQQVQIPEGTTLDDLEKEAVEQALERHGGNRTHAARSLKISVRTLQRKLKVWGLDSVALHQVPTHSKGSNGTLTKRSSWPVHAEDDGDQRTDSWG